MITARTALLQALREGPGYGRELVRCISRASAGRLRFAEGSIYPALRHLEAARLVRSWEVVPGRRRGGRARTYYELTERGVRVSEADRAALLRLAAPESPHAAGSRGVPADARADRAAARISATTAGAALAAGSAAPVEVEPHDGGSRPASCGWLGRSPRLSGPRTAFWSGGLAVMAHGFVRGTRDVDLHHPPSAGGSPRAPRGERPRRPVSSEATRSRAGSRCLKGECDGLPFDVLPPLVPVHWEAAPRVEAGARARCASFP